jgi:hypothetical protein
MVFLLLCEIPGCSVGWEVRNKEPSYFQELARKKNVDRSDCHTEKRYRDSHNRHDDKDPFPGRKAIFPRQRRQEPSLDPTASHAAELPKDTEHGCASAQLGVLVPRSKNKLCTDTITVSLVHSHRRKRERRTRRWQKILLQSHSIKSPATPQLSYT